MPIIHLTTQGSLAEIILNSLDILTFVVPPILPAALTANNAFAQKRLGKKGIFCLHSKHICLCGGIDVVAFDKVSDEEMSFYWKTRMKMPMFSLAPCFLAQAGCGGLDWETVSSQPP